jgi:hypothetical protein
VGAKRAARGSPAKRAPSFARRWWRQSRIRLPWLQWAPGGWEAYIQSDDALDAVLAALVARAAALGFTILPSDADIGLARTEGWIHLPNSDSLPALLGD